MICAGVGKEYAEMFGTDELSPEAVRKDLTKTDILDYLDYVGKN